MLTAEELMGDSIFSKRDWRFINPKLWDNNVSAPDDEIDAISATTYIARAISDYTHRPTGDEELFAEFCQDFEGWTEVMFKQAHFLYTRELKRILRFKGVYTGHLNMPPAKAFLGLLNSTKYPRWPDELFQETLFDTRTAAHMLQQRLIQGHPVTRFAQPVNIRASKIVRISL